MVIPLLSVSLKKETMGTRNTQSYICKTNKNIILSFQHTHKKNMSKSLSLIFFPTFEVQEKGAMH